MELIKQINKYQEALDELDEETKTENVDEVPIHREEIFVLQKLIDKYGSLINFINLLETNDMDNDEKWETLISTLEGDY